MATFLFSRTNQVRCLVSSVRQFTLKSALKRSLNTAVYQTYQTSQRLKNLYDAQNVNKLFCRTLKGGLVEPRPRMSDEHIQERVFKVCQGFERINTAKLTLESHFMNDLGLDSLDHVEVIMGIEDEFHFIIPDENAVKLFRPIDIVNYIKEKDNALNHELLKDEEYPKHQS